LGVAQARDESNPTRGPPAAQLLHKSPLCSGPAALLRGGPPFRPSSQAQRPQGRHRVVCFFMPAHLACQSIRLTKISKKMADENRRLPDRLFRPKGQGDMTMTMTVLTIIGCYSAISSISTAVVLTWGRARARRIEVPETFLTLLFAILIISA
jgi:hypothetical protein